MKGMLGFGFILVFWVISSAVRSHAGEAGAGAPPGIPSPTLLVMPDGAPGIGFDDLQFDPHSRRVLVPAGRTGDLDLIDPDTHRISSLHGFSKAPAYSRGHGQGVTSVASGLGMLFVTDRTGRTLDAVDPGTNEILSRVPLASGPDYVRFIAATRELWITEPDRQRIEIFSLPKLSESKSAPPQHAGFIETAGGPESLVIDPVTGRAYTHLWKGAKTLAISIRERRIVTSYPSGCDEDPQGIALDGARGFLFVGCEDGTAVVLDLKHEGRILSKLQNGKGVDIIAYDPALSHLYMPGAESATLAIMQVGRGGRLRLLGTVKTTLGGHCATVDDRNTAYICDPRRGALLLVHDPFPNGSESR